MIVRPTDAARHHWLSSTGVVLLALLLHGCGGGDDEGPNQHEGHTHGPAVTEQSLLNHLEHQPGDVDARLQLANYYYDTDRPHRAIEHYQQVLEARPNNPDVRTDLGTCYKRIHNLEQARAEYERVLANHPKHVHATFNLAVVNSLMGHHLRAADLWERAAALAPGTNLALQALARATNAREAAAATKPATQSATKPEAKETP